MLTLGPDEVHIHLLEAESVFEPIAASLLDITERQRAQAFKFAQDRDLYVAAHVFLRQVLSRYVKIDPATWRFTHNTYGKPAIANPGCAWLQFNLSHTHGSVACAVARERPIGVDVETRKQLINLPALCQYAFSPTEAANVLAQPLEQQEKRFFSYWTLKEAYIKARGMGMSLPLQQFTFRQDANHAWHLHDTTPDGQDEERHWQADTCRLNNNHYLAYCVQTQASDHALVVKVMEADECRYNERLCSCYWSSGIGNTWRY